MHANPYIGVKVRLGGIIKNNLIKEIFEDWSEILGKKPKEKSFLFFLLLHLYNQGF